MHPAPLKEPDRSMHFFYEALINLQLFDKIIAKKLQNDYLAEAAKLPLKKFDAFLAVIRAKTELAKNLKTLHDAANPNFYQEDSVLLQQAVEDFTQAFGVARETLGGMALELIKASNNVAPLKDMQLLNKTMEDLNRFYQDPKKEENLNNIIADSKQIYRKIGPFWHNCSIALTTIIGAGCIIIGVLGLIPSLLMSSALIKVGALLCVVPHLPTALKTKAHQERQAGAQASREIHALFNKAKKLRASTEKQAVDQPPGYSESPERNNNGR